MQNKHRYLWKYTATPYDNILVGHSNNGHETPRQTDYFLAPTLGDYTITQ